MLHENMITIPKKNDDCFGSGEYIGAVLPDYKFIVVGALFFGSVIAERIATGLGEKVLLIEQRTHIGGIKEHR